LILASSSPYRRQLLERLRLPFVVRAPEIDESRHPGESPGGLVARLARDKAMAIARNEPEAVVIGSDQIAVCGQAIVTKPGTAAAAEQQLADFSGATVEFLTAVNLHCIATGLGQGATVATTVVFRRLEPAEIRRYVAQENPIDCAGSFKAEGAGISLFRRIQSEDPTALIGLPLIALSCALRSAGYPVP
jgi:septum formation protein